jgi:hypothetical protein
MPFVVTGGLVPKLGVLRTGGGLTSLREPRVASRPFVSAPHPDNRAGCGGAPEGRCASLRDGPPAHPSPAAPRPERSGLGGTDQ